MTAPAAIYDMPMQYAVMVKSGRLIPVRLGHGVSHSTCQLPVVLPVTRYRQLTLNLNILVVFNLINIALTWRFPSS